VSVIGISHRIVRAKNQIIFTKSHLLVHMCQTNWELIIDQMVRFFIVEPIHLGSSSRLVTGAHTFLDLFKI
jgi:hypothetical protein